MDGGKGNHFEKPEYYLNKTVIASMDYSELIEVYNHYRRIVKRILKNRRDFDGLKVINYKRAIERLYPPVVKVRCREFLEKYMYNVALFLTLSRGDAHGYKDEV